MEASIAYARGEPVVSDDAYEVLKTQVRSRGEKRADVTALLLYTKGRQLLEPEEYDRLSDEMLKLGIEVSFAHTLFNRLHAKYIYESPQPF